MPLYLQSRHDLDGEAARRVKVERPRMMTLRGLNVTLPFKEQALALADRVLTDAIRADARTAGYRINLAKVRLLAKDFDGAASALEALDVRDLSAAEAKELEGLQRALSPN